MELNDSTNKYANFVNLKKTRWRFVVLFLQCYLVAEGYYVLSSCNSVQVEIQKYFGIDFVEYNLLTSIYGIPNVIMCFVSGNIIYHFGLRNSNLTFVLLIWIGHSIFAFSPYFENYYIALFGRLLVGIGCELQQCSMFYIINIWFKNREMALATSFTVLALRIGAVVPDLIIPAVYIESHSLIIAQLPGIVISGIGVIFAILFNMIDRYNSEQLKLKQLSETTNQTNFTMMIEEDKITLSSFKQMGKKFWIFSFLIICMYGTFQPFNANLNSLIRMRFGYDIVKAGQVIAVPSTIIALCSPIFGLISDKHGHRGDILILASAFLMISQAIMGSLPTCKQCPDIVYAIFLFQISYAFFITNIWAALRLIVPKHLRGVGVGIVNSLQNVGYFFSSMLIGGILDGFQDKIQGYQFVNYSMAFLNLTGFITLSIWSCCYDRHSLNAKKRIDP